MHYLRSTAGVFQCITNQFFVIPSSCLRSRFGVFYTFFTSFIFPLLDSTTSFALAFLFWLNNWLDIIFLLIFWVTLYCKYWNVSIFLRVIMRLIFQMFDIRFLLWRKILSPSLVGILMIIEFFRLKIGRAANFSEDVFLLLLFFSFYYAVLIRSPDIPISSR